MEEYVPLDWGASNSIIKVVGVGGGGSNAVNQMYRHGIMNVDFLVCNTDTQALKDSPVTQKIQLGNVLTRGLGAGCNPEQGRKAALESVEQIKEMLSGSTEMVFITAGMGGGTGTGAAPVIAQVSKELGLLTVGVVTLPFRDEGPEFMTRAVLGIKEMEKYVDSLLIIDNQKLYKIYGDLSIFDAFPKADNVLSTAVKGIAEIITRPGFINVDFADVRMVMNNSGMAILGTGSASGENRAARSVEEAFNSPLLNDLDLTTAKNVLVNITSSKDHGLTMSELSQIMDYIKEYTGTAVNFKRGVVCDPSVGEAISVTVVATGFNMNSLPQISTKDGKPVITVTLGEEDDEKESIRKHSNISPSVEKVDSFKKDFIDLDVPQSAQIQKKTTETPKQPQPDRPTAPGISIKKDKPSLILDPGENITQIENVPAYIRKQQKNSQSQTKIADATPSAQTGTFRLEEIDGKNFLTSDNSFLHQTQD